MENKKMKKKEELWEKHGRALRDPMEVICANYENLGLAPELLNYEVEGEFIEILEKLKVTLLVTREYENLVIALNVEEGRLRQTFLPLPHPSGVAVDRQKGIVYIAATRNPNQIWTLGIIEKYFKRKERNVNLEKEKILVPLKVKFYPGSYYFHELAIIDGDLYADSVGMNAIIKLDLNTLIHEEPIWWPKNIENKNGVPDFEGNYMQLNSIGAGTSLDKSFFTAFSFSDSKIPRTMRPWRFKRSSKKEGVLISGKTREPYAQGFMQPHSARINSSLIWLANSGCGEVVAVDKKNCFQSIARVSGWTRGLCFVKNILFVGSSRIHAGRNAYAPDLNPLRMKCGVYIMNIKTGKIEGALTWPFGNQVFSVDWLPKSLAIGFPFERMRRSVKYTNNFFYLMDYAE